MQKDKRLMNKEELRSLRGGHKLRIEQLKDELKGDDSKLTAWKVIPLSLIAESELQIKLIDTLL